MKDMLIEGEEREHEERVEEDGEREDSGGRGKRKEETGKKISSNEQWSLGEGIPVWCVGGPEDPLQSIPFSTCPLARLFSYVGGIICLQRTDVSWNLTTQITKALVQCA